MKQILLTIALTLAAVSAAAQSFTYKEKKYDWRIVYGSYETMYGTLLTKEKGTPVDSPLTIFISKERDVAIVLKDKAMEFRLEPNRLGIVPEKNTIIFFEYFNNNPSVIITKERDCDIYMGKSMQEIMNGNEMYRGRNLQTPEQIDEILTWGKNMQETGKIYDIVEVPAQFPGGDAKREEWISENMKYPTIAKELEISGRVIVSFVVNVSGALVESKVIKEAGHQSLSKEALRLVNHMPLWIPAQKDGKPVRSRYTLSINFR